MNWKEASVDAVVLAMFWLHTYHVNEIERGLAGLGNYRLLPRYNAEAKDAKDIQDTILLLMFYGNILLRTVRSIFFFLLSAKYL